jgi:hypothetical protein
MAGPKIYKLRTDQLACPYFMPVERLQTGAWPHPARLPLGCGWSGHCTAPGHQGEVPTQDILEAFCNLGYAGRCRWAPQDRPWDAVRFAVSAPSDSAVKEAGKNLKNRAPAQTLRLDYVCERSHLPVAHGELEFDLSRSVWLRSHADTRIQKMAECFLESYLEKKA